MILRQSLRLFASTSRSMTMRSCTSLGSRGLSRNNRLLRYFSEQPENQQAKEKKPADLEEEEFQKIFRGEFDKKTYTKDEIYELLKPINDLRNPAKFSFGTGLVFITASCGLFFFGWNISAAAIGLVGLFQVASNYLLVTRLKRLVSEIKLNPEKTKAVFIFGADGTKATVPIQNIKPVRTVELVKGSSFLLLLTLVDDLERKYEMREVLLDRQACRVENMNLLTSVLSGKLAAVQEFTKTDDESDDESAKTAETATKEDKSEESDAKEKVRAKTDENATKH